MQYKVFVRLERHVDTPNWPPIWDVSVLKQKEIKAFLYIVVGWDGRPFLNNSLTWLSPPHRYYRCCCCAFGWDGEAVFKLFRKNIKNTVSGGNS